jgi:hypothetical protein
MPEQTAVQSCRLSREELYALVWKIPINRLAKEFGITGTGLVKICDRLEVPYPPLGYWARKEAGKPVVTFKLPARSEGIHDWVDIYPTPPKPAPLPAAQVAAATATATVGEITVSETLHDLHPKVRGWIAQHKQDQKERERENKRYKREFVGWTAPSIEDLTERDLYRFRVTSAIFKAVEKSRRQDRERSDYGQGGVFN